MVRARAIAATPAGVLLLMSLPLWIVTAGLAHGRTPAPIDYAGVSPSEAAAPVRTAALTPVRASLSAPARGPLAVYGYGEEQAPASGPTLDLRGAFGASAPAAAPLDLRQVSKTAPALPNDTTGAPVDIRPPPTEPALAAEQAPALGADAAPRGAFLIQIGAFAQKANADRAGARCAAIGKVLVDTIPRASGALYRVRLGAWDSRSGAENARAALVELGFADARVTEAN